MDKTHITCALMPRRKSERLLKVYRKSEEKSDTKKPKLKNDEPKCEFEIAEISSENKNSKNKIAKASTSGDKLHGDNCSTAHEQLASQQQQFVAENEVEEIIQSDNEDDTPNIKRLRRSFFEASMTRRTKIEVPKETLKTNNIYKIRKCKVRLKRIKLPTDVVEKSLRLKAVSGKMVGVNSPSVFSDISSPVFHVTSPSFSSLSGRNVLNPVLNPKPFELGSIITPMLLPPTRAEALASAQQLELFDHEYPTPFYGNPADVGKSKEVGFMMLQLKGNKLNDLMEYESGIGVAALLPWRRKKLLDMGGMALLSHFKTTQKIREYCASLRRVVIVPQLSAPSRYDAKLWLKARELLQQQNGAEQQHAQADEDSPIKVRRQKVTMMLRETDGEDVLDCSMHSLTLTPMTPSSPLLVAVKQPAPAETPLSTEPVAEQSKRKLRRRRESRAKLSLTTKLKAAVEAELSQGSSKTLSPISASVPNSQNSDSSINSDLVLAALDRTSFLKEVQCEKSACAGSHDVSFGLSHATLDNTFGFKVNLENLQQAKSDIECNYMTTISLEVFVPTREDLYPNPEIDELRCIFYAIENSVPASADETLLPQKACGYIIVRDFHDCLNSGLNCDLDVTVTVVQTEVEALQALLELCARWDPDIFAGYEIEMQSWGFILERAKYLCINIAPLLSRVPTQKVRDFVDEEREQLTDFDVEVGTNT